LFLLTLNSLQSNRDGEAAGGGVGRVIRSPPTKAQSQAFPDWELLSARQRESGS